MENINEFREKILKANKKLSSEEVKELLRKGGRLCIYLREYLAK